MIHYIIYTIAVFVLFTLIAGTHYYIWIRLVRDTKLSPPFYNIITSCLILSVFIAPTFTLLASKFPRAFWSPLYWLASICLGEIFLILVCIVIMDIFRLSHSILYKLTSIGIDLQSPSRRQFFMRGMGISSVLGAFSLGSIALKEGLSLPKIKKIKVKLKKFPKKMDGTTILQITDLHIGATIQKKRVNDIVKQTNNLNPDIIAITGDLVDGSVLELSDFVEPLKHLKARYGVFFVTGNHEYYSGAIDWIEKLKTLGITVLQNERVHIGDKDNGFDLAGINDLHAGRIIKSHKSDIKKAVAGRDLSKELVLLAHQPKSIFEASKHNVGLQLSGHTHGGQLWPLTYLIKWHQGYLHGLYKHTEDTQIYVCCGAGFWGPPMRLKAPSELALIELFHSNS